ncbi:MAG: glycosyltransferase [Phycisphaerae bacterium]|nr:glycosyltransferase [Phycisphaerae bacterium]
MPDSSAASHARPINIALLGTYVPRRCGIGTFTADLCNSIKTQLNGRGSVFAVAMDDVPEGYDYPPEVRLEIRADMARDYRMAAEYLNISPVDVVVIQHEFGIFGGGEGGTYINTFLERLRKPVMATLHTVLEKPAPEYERAMQRLIRFCERLIVMSLKGKQMLMDIYGVPEQKIVFIPHGIPDVPFVDPNFYKDELDLAGRRAILTFGLLSPNKGIENMIRAMPAIVEKYPRLAYVVLGATHPHVKRRYGEQYRNSLKSLAAELGVENNVVFVNKFVELDELCRYIGAADVYVTPYMAREQITSGTLAYAIGAGKAVVSTPYWYAEELLADGRGKLVEFGSTEDLSREILWLFDNEVERHAMRKRAYMYARRMIWSQVGADYINLANEVCSQRPERPRPVVTPREYDRRLSELPEINLQHLHTLTDHVGIIQHAKYATPERQHGYCTDDVARAMVFTAMHWSLYEDSAIIPLMHVYLGFLHHAFCPETGRFHNFLTYDLKWVEQGAGSEDSHSRALWGLGNLVADAPDHSLLALANMLFHDALPQVTSFTHPRSLGFALLGIHSYLRRFNVDTEIRSVREKLARSLMGWYKRHASDEWFWCQDEVTYCNAVLPHALLLAGPWLPDNEMLTTGLRSLRWLLDVQTNDEGQLSIIGNNGWFQRSGHRARFDQQPVDAMCLARACIEAYNVTADLQWLREARKCFEWFMGRNDLNLPVYDFRTGGCRDGLVPTGVNQNQGAESTLAWLISLASMHMVSKQISDTHEEKAAMNAISQNPS